MLQTMQSAHTCPPHRSIDAHKIWRHCDFTRVLTKSQIHVIDRRRCQRDRSVGHKDIFVLVFGCVYRYCARDDPSWESQCTPHEFWTSHTDNPSSAGLSRYAKRRVCELLFHRAVLLYYPGKFWMRLDSSSNDEANFILQIGHFYIYRDFAFSCTHAFHVIQNFCN